MRYISTRGSAAVCGAEAIVRGLAPDGGLYVPESFPAVDTEKLNEWSALDYPTLAARVLYEFLPEYGLERLERITRLSAERFSVPEVTPLVKVDDDAYFLELWHGPTHAFKDVALTTLPHLLVAAKELTGVETSTLILVATSGDTGKAALEGFCDVRGTRIAVLYPSEGVSALQKLQMTTQDGGNVAVYGIKGNFDDAQTAVKKIFTDEAFAQGLREKGIELSSANSINLGRLLPQVVYYFSAYFDLVSSGEISMMQPVNFCVPTGNFGDILAGFYAKRMGLPVGKLLCASNSNNVLTEFLEEGTYDAAREFHKTISPSMDILISSNLERLLFEACGRDAARTKTLMTELSQNKTYTVTEEEYNFVAETFLGECATEEETKDEIADFFDDVGYVMDPHTAVAACCLDKRYDELDGKTVVLSTASPYKFVEDVLDAIGEKRGKTLDESLNALEQATALEIPATVAELTQKTVRFREILDKDKIAAAIKSYAEGGI